MAFVGRIILLVAVVMNMWMFNMSKAAAEFDVEVAKIVARVVSDRSWVVAWQDQDSALMFNTRFVYVDGSKEKPKLDVWEAYVVNNEISSVFRKRYYYGKNKVQDKTLMFANFYNNSIDECYQTGITASKKDIKTGSVGDIVQKKVYNTCYSLGYLNVLK